MSPRRATLDPLAASGRRPLGIVPVDSPNRYHPVISSATEKPSSPFKSRPREEEPHYLLPASTASSRREHHRTYSGDNSANIGRYLSDGRDRHERAGYRSSGISGRRQGYNLNMPLVRQSKEGGDEDPGYEYTDRKEQMFRDTAPRPRQRRTSDSGRRERPHSMTGLEDYPSRLLQGSRDSRPPVTTRGFDKLDRSGSLRHEYRIPREPDPLPQHVPFSDTEDLRRHRSNRSSRAPVSLHQERDAPSVDDGYSSYKEDYRKAPRDRHGHGSRGTGSLDLGLDDHGLGVHLSSEDDRHRVPNDRSGRHHEADSHRARGDLDDRDRHHRAHHRHGRSDDEDVDRRTRDEHRKDRPEKGKASEDLPMGAAALGAAALVAEGIRERSHRRNDSADLDPRPPLPDRTRNRGDDRLALVPDQDDSSGRNGENSDEEHRQRQRRRQREKEHQQEEEARLSGKARGRNEELAPHTDKSRQGSGSYERDSQYASAVVPEHTEPRTSHRQHHHQTHDEESYSDVSAEDERRNSDDRKRSRVRVVSPPKDEKPEIKPKGILRPPREKFPEDPAPVREGVAPLKDAGKKGIPPGARWTKIDRKLVNAEALEQGNERFEERVDYVIVLRVLTKEEIEAYAQRTQEIRGMRTPLAWKEEVFLLTRSHR